MKRFTTLLLLLFCSSIFSQNSYTISGRIKDKSSTETLIGVTILAKELKKGGFTNEYGFYSLSLPEGNHTIEISYLGYGTITQEISLSSNQKLDFELEENAEALESVVIKSYTEKISIKKAEMSVNKMSQKTIKVVPAVLGEVDVLKSITTLPGVTNAGEGQSGFNVRGGAADQNLVLLDEATIYNTSHVFGFFSVFNADAIKDLKLYKGGIPSKFGGRVSSVLDIHQKDGNKRKFGANGGIGTLSSRLTLEGPLKKDEASFFISGRRSYFDLFFPLIPAVKGNTLNFYDLNAKLNWEIDDKNKLFLSGYFGNDVVKFGTLFNNSYGNATANLRWNHVFNDKLFSNTSIIYSKYDYQLTLDFVGFEWNSFIENINLKYDLMQYYDDDIKIGYGLSSIGYHFNPGKIGPNREDSSITERQIAKKFAIESGAYIDVEHKINDKLDLRYGLRLTNFLRLGNNQYNTYVGDPVLYDTNTTLYEANTPIKVDRDLTDIQENYWNFEPRFSFAYSLNDKSSVKGSYQRTAQYLHLISNTQSPAPLDVWTPSGEYLKPQIGDQIAIGYNYNFNNSYSMIVEAFGKKIKNRLDYIDGADLVGQENIETQVLAGNSRAYGLELQLKKDLGKFTGWISYTLSRSEQLTEGRTAEEIGINNGNWYNTAYDKTHDLSILGTYKFNKKWSVNANFTFQTGQPVTYPIGKYEYKGSEVVQYGPRAADRLPVYHRLDLGATYKPKGDIKDRKFYGEWVFSIYNAYNRANTFSISFQPDEDSETGAVQAFESTLFPLIPSVTYNFKF